MSGSTENAAIPPGYALVPPNLLVPLSSLQTSIAAAQQPMQVCTASSSWNIYNFLHLPYLLQDSVNAREEAYMSHALKQVIVCEDQEAQAFGTQDIPNLHVVQVQGKPKAVANVMQCLEI